MSTAAVRLDTIDAGYRHHVRIVEPGSPLALPGAVLKWYDLRRAEATVPTTARRAARALLGEEAAAGRLGIGSGLGFVVLHHSDERIYLIVGVWRNNQELWQALFVRDHDGAGRFERRRPGFDAPTVCVWELAPVWHEREAWVRFLWSERDEAAKLAYLLDHMSGPV